MVGQAVYAVAVDECGEGYSITSKIRLLPNQEAVNADALFDSMALSIAEHIVNLCPSDMEACDAIAWFMHQIHKYGAQYLEEKYGEKEDMEDGSIEN